MNFFQLEFPDRTASLETKREYLVGIVLYSFAALLVAGLVGVGIAAASGIRVGVNWIETSILFGLVALGILFIWLKLVLLSRYLVVAGMFGFSVWGTIQYGFSSIAVLGYVITLLLGYLLISRRLGVVLGVLVIPLIVIVFLQPEARSQTHTIAVNIFLIALISLLLEIMNWQRASVDRELEKVSQLEAARQAGFSVVSSLDLQETITTILEELKNILPHDSASVLLMREGGFLEIVGGSGWENPEEVIGIRFPIPGDNPNSIVIQTGQPYILHNAQKEHAPFREAPHDHIRSWLGVPLIEDANIIGMMAIDSKNVNHFSEEHIQVVSSFAAHVAIAMENARIYDVANRAIHRQSILYHASQEVISAGADLERIYSIIHDSAEEVMPCEAFVITLLEHSGETIEGVYLIDRGGRNESFSIPVGRGLSGRVVSTGEAILVDDVLEEQDFDGAHFGHEDHIRSLVAVPLTVGNKVIGMLSAQSYDASAYDESDVKFLELLAAQGGVAIENARLLARMEHMANTDALTGLYNRRAFDSGLEEEVRRATRYGYPISLLILDIDDFKQFNDKFGHSRGDEHLKEIANLIVESVRQPDMVSRIGGEEFSVILPHTLRRGARDLAERIRENIEDAFDGKFKVGHTISIGMAELPLDAGSLEKLFDAADKALYKAKMNGKNQVCAPTDLEWPQ